MTHTTQFVDFTFEKEVQAEISYRMNNTANVEINYTYDGE